jgi:hypothetical protein
VDPSGSRIDPDEESTWQGYRWEDSTGGLYGSGPLDETAWEYEGF